MNWRADRTRVGNKHVHIVHIIVTGKTNQSYLNQTLMKKVSFMEKGLNKISELELGRQSKLLSDVWKWSSWRFTDIPFYHDFENTSFLKRKLERNSISTTSC